MTTFQVHVASASHLGVHMPFTILFQIFSYFSSSNHLACQSSPVQKLPTFDLDSLTHNNCCHILEVQNYNLKLQDSEKNSILPILH